MPAITGDTAGIHSLSGSWGSAAGSAGSQAQNFGQAYAALPVSSFSGGAADRMRSFVSEMRAGAAALARAYDRVASYLPRVAHAIDDAKRAAAALERAQQALTSAEQRLAAAERAVTSALTAVMSATSPLSVAAPFAGAPVCAPGAPGALGAPAGPSPAQLAALAQAQRQQAQAARQVEQATRALHAADNHFQEADRVRMSVLRAFTTLCQTESAIAMRALPQAPTPPMGFPGLMGMSMAFPVTPLATTLLMPEAKALANVPTLADLGFLTITMPQLASALKHQQWQQIDNAVPTFQPLVPPAGPKKSGGGGGFLGLGHVVHFVEGVGQGVVEGATGTAVGMFHLGKLLYQAAPLISDDPGPGAFRAGQQLLGMAEAPFVHPLRFGQQLIDLPQLEKDPAKWIGGVGFTAALTVGTDGVGTEAKVAADSAKAAKEAALSWRAITPIAHSIDPSLGTIARTNADHFGQLGSQLEATNSRLESVQRGLEAYDKTSNTVGVAQASLGASQPEACQAGAGGVGRDYLAGKLVDHADRGLLPR